MELATITLALAGDDSNTIQKYEVTPSEVAILNVIHGDGAVKDIAITGETDRRSREERARLVEIYSKQQPDGSKRAPAVDALFPGVAARLFETFDELELDDVFFAPKTQKAKQTDPLDHDEDGKKGGSKKRASKKKVEEPVETTDEQAEDQDGELPDDGISDMDDNNLFK